MQPETLTALWRLFPRDFLEHLFEVKPFPLTLVGGMLFGVSA